MAFVVEHFAIFDEQDLRGFMRDAKALRHQIGQRSESNQIQVVRGDFVRVLGFPVSQETIQGHAANGAAGTVLEK